MPKDPFWFGLSLGFAVAALVFGWLFLRYRSHVSRSCKERFDKSRSVLKGQLSERMAPHLPGFPFQSADARFLGHPVDYVVFDGLHGDGPVEVALVEIKTGKSKLSTNERRVREAVENQRVSFHVIRFSDEDIS